MLIASEVVKITINIIVAMLRDTTATMEDSPASMISWEWEMVGRLVPLRSRLALRELVAKQGKKEIISTLIGKLFNRPKHR